MTGAPVPFPAAASTAVDGVAPEFSALFVDSYDSVTRGLALALGDDELARDAAAEGFTRALARWRKVGRYRNPAGWVYRVGLNWAISRRRRTRRETTFGELPVDAVAPMARATADPDLVVAIAALPIDQRAVVVARYFFDWSERETADALDIRPGTVKSRLSRALDRLATRLDPTDGVASTDGSMTDASQEDTDD